MAALGGNLPGWCVDVGMCGTGTRVRAAAWCGGHSSVCGAASRFIPLQGDNSV